MTAPASWPAARSRGLGLPRAATACILAVILTPHFPPAAAQDDAARPMRMGFVDLKRAFYAFHKTKQLEQQLNEFKDAQEKELVAEAESLAKLKTHLEQMDLTTNWGKEQERKLILKVSRLEFNKRWIKSELEEKLGKMTVELHLDIMNAIRLYAEAERYDAIFQVDTEPLHASSPDELKLLMRSRGVLYFRKPLDLTDAIIRLLNRDAPSEEPHAGNDPAKDPPK